MELTKKYFDKKFEQMAQMIKKGFDATATQAHVDERFDLVEKRIDDLEKDRGVVQKVKDALSLD